MLTCPLPIATNKYFPDGSNANSFTSSFNDSTLIVFKFRLSRILKESSLSPYAKYVPHGDQATFKFCAINEKRMKKKKKKQSMLGYLYTIILENSCMRFKKFRETFNFLTMIDLNKKFVKIYCCRPFIRLKEMKRTNARFTIPIYDNCRIISRNQTEFSTSFSRRNIKIYLLPIS